MKYLNKMALGACVLSGMTLAGCPDPVPNSALVFVHNDDADRSIDEIFVQGVGDEGFGENILGDNPLGPQENIEIPVDAPIRLFNADGVQVRVRVDYEAGDIADAIEGPITKTFTNVHSGEKGDFHVEPGDDNSSQALD